MTRTLTPRGSERRRQLTAFATARFAEQGYHPTSVADICAGLGVGKGVFYWYFTSKEELFLEILHEAHQDLRRAQQAALADEADPVGRIERGIRASLQWFEQHHHLINLFQLAATDERFRDAWRREQQVAFDDVLRHVKEGIVEGRIRDADPTMLTQALVAVTRELSRTLLHERGVNAAEVADVVVAFVLEGLTGGATPGAHR